MADNETPNEVEAALAELREMFGDGNTIRIAFTVQVGFRHWSGNTLAEAMAKARKYHEESK